MNLAAELQARRMFFHSGLFDWLGLRDIFGQCRGIVCASRTYEACKSEKPAWIQLTPLVHYNEQVLAIRFWRMLC